MIDPKGNDLLDKVTSLCSLNYLFIYFLERCLQISHSFFFQAMAEDKSDEWFAKHNKQKASA